MDNLIRKVQELRIGDTMIEQSDTEVKRKRQTFVVRRLSLCTGTRGNIHVETVDGKSLCYWGESIVTILP